MDGMPQGAVTCTVYPQSALLVTFLIGNVSTRVGTWSALWCSACGESGKKLLQTHCQKMPQRPLWLKSDSPNSGYIICYTIHVFGNGAVAAAPCDHFTLSGEICLQPHAAHVTVALFCITNNRHCVIVTTHAIKRHFHIWVTTLRQPMKGWCYFVLTLRYTFICVYWWTRQRIRNTLIVVDQYLRLIWDKMMPDSDESRLESLYPRFVAGIDLPQGVMDSYNHWVPVCRYGPRVPGSQCACRIIM